MQHNGESLVTRCHKHQYCGCSHHDCCLGCELPHCVHEAVERGKDPAIQARDDQICKLRQSGLGPETLALAYNLSMRTIYRVVSNAR